MDAKIRTFIVDDEYRAIKNLQRRAAMRDDLIIVGTSTDPCVALREIPNLNVQLVFVDMKMEGMNGLDLIQQLGPDKTYICCSAYNDYGPDLSSLDVPYYLLKPADEDKFNSIVDLCLKNMYLKEQGQQAIADKLLIQNGGFVVKIRNKNETLNIPFEDIEAFHGQGDDTLMYYTEGSILAAERLRYIEERIPSSMFVRTSRSYIVAKHQLKSYISPNRLSLRKGSALATVPLSDTYKETILKELNLITKKNDESNKPTS